MRIHLGTQANSDKTQLLLTRTRPTQLPPAPGDDSNEQAVLVDDLENLRIEYFGAAGDGSGPVWQSSWDAPRMLPNLVRISVQPADGNAWPILVASPLLGTAPLAAEVPETPEDADEPVEEALP